MLSPNSFDRVLKALPTRIRVQLVLRRIENVRLEPPKYDLPLGFYEFGLFPTARVYGIDAPTSCTKDELYEEMEVVEECRMILLMTLCSFRTFYSKKMDLLHLPSNVYDLIYSHVYQLKKDHSIVFVTNHYPKSIFEQTFSCMRWSYDGERYTCEDVAAILDNQRSVNDDVLIEHIKNEMVTMIMNRGSRTFLTRFSIMLLSFSEHIDIDVDFWKDIKMKNVR